MAGLWSEGIKRSKGEAAADKETKEEKESMDAIWQERHFQVCLALMNRTDRNNCNTWNIINQADRMIASLKEHYSTSSPCASTDAQAHGGASSDAQ